MNSEIIQDIEKKLNIEFDKCKINYFNDGATNSIVLSIDDKYTIKTFDDISYKVQVEFLNKYKNNYFQKIVYENEKLKYLCFEYIEGSKIKKTNILDLNDIVSQIYEITSNYEEYDYDSYGYLFDDYNKSWYDFLADEVNYSKQEIENISITKVESAFEVIKKYKTDKYLIHGDFGTHNFLIKNNKISVIDPMGVIGDCLYDFYFAIFSDALIFMNLNLDYILSFYNHDMEYKKALLIIVLYIRMSRTHKYNINDFDKYLELYNKI